MVSDNIELYIKNRIDELKDSRDTSHGIPQYWDAQIDELNKVLELIKKFNKGEIQNANKSSSCSETSRSGRTSSKV
jgi:hypothetical protein